MDHTSQLLPQALVQMVPCTPRLGSATKPTEKIIKATQFISIMIVTGDMIPLRIVLGEKEMQISM